MATDGDDSVVLPKPPPPRPAARRDAIDAAMRKFDGVEPAPVPKRSSWAGWVPRDRRAIGAFATAAIVAVVSVPVALTTLRNDPPPSLPKASETPARPQLEETTSVAADTATLPAEEVATGSAPAAATEPAPATRSVQAPPALVAAPDQRSTSIEEMAKAMEAAPASVMAPAPPPPPPPPPPPAPERDSQTAEDAGGDIVVSGSRVRRNEVGKQRYAPSAGRETLDSAGALAAVEARSDFLSQLQSAFRANDRQTVLALVALPLRVRVDGKTEIYRSVREIERDFDEIFTPQVKQSVLNQRADGTSRVRFGPIARNGPFRIREVRP